LVAPIVRGANAEATCVDIFNKLNQMPQGFGFLANGVNVNAAFDFNNLSLNQQHGDGTQTIEITRVERGDKEFDWREVTPEESRIGFNVVYVLTNEDNIIVMDPRSTQGFAHGDVRQPIGDIVRVVFCSEEIAVEPPQPALARLDTCLDPNDDPNVGLTDDQLRAIFAAIGKNRYITVHRPGPYKDVICAGSEVAAKQCLNLPVCSQVEGENCEEIFGDNREDWCDPNDLPNNKAQLPCCSFSPFTVGWEGPDSGPPNENDVLPKRPAIINGRGKGVINNPVKGSTCDNTTTLSGDVIASQQCQCDYVYPGPPDWCCTYDGTWSCTQL
jgi:hypothetical protein